jgi:uncharacterized membrane protein YdjX (TVP38/TMEM64 family)
MKNHNKNDSGMKAMIWMMVLCCLFLILPFIFLGHALTGESLWPMFAIAAVFIAVHFLMHRGHKEKHTNTTHSVKDQNSINNNK